VSLGLTKENNVFVPLEVESGLIRENYYIREFYILDKLSCKILGTVFFTSSYLRKQLITV
jgi:hypothetical protein